MSALRLGAPPSVRRNPILVSDDSAFDMSLALISGERLRAGEAERERMLKRAGAGIAVAVLHVLFLLALLTAGHFAAQRPKPQPKETILYLQPPHQKSRETAPPIVVAPPIITTRPEEVLHPPTITVAPTPPLPQSKNETDVLQNIGKELACGAGPYEHLTQAEREDCKRHPWKWKKNAKGVIVMDKPEPQLNLDEPGMTGADQATHQQQTADPCLAAGNTHSECAHKTIFGH